MTNRNDSPPAARHRTWLAAAAVLALSLGAASQAHAVPPCNADVFVKNEQSASIKVLRFLYTVNGVERSESLVNKRLAPGETEEWPNQALNHAAEGNWISNTRVEYKRDNSGAGDGYGPPEMSGFFPHSTGYVCLDDRNYWIGVRVVPRVPRPHPRSRHQALAVGISSSRVV